MNSIKQISLSLLLPLFFLPLTVPAQVGSARRALALGVNGGVAMNTVGFDPTIKQSMHIAPTLGLTLRMTSEKYFKSVCALQIELNYALLGWKEQVLDYNGEPLPDTYSRNMSYIQIPFLARMGWGRERRGAMGYVLAGPQVGYCIGDAAQRSSVWTLNEATGYPDRPNGLSAQYDLGVQRRFDYGITAGAGLELSSKIGHFMIEGRYYYGLGDFFNNAKKDVFGRSNNNTIMVKFTYLFDLRKEYEDVK